MNAIQQLLGALPAETDGALLESEVNRRYFTGFPASDGVLLLARGGASFLTDSRYTEAARRVILEMPVVDIAQLGSEMERLGMQRIALEAERLSVARHHRLCERYAEKTFVCDGTLDSAVDALRMLKHTDELASIRAAQRIAEQALERILPLLKSGKSEKELAALLDYTMLQLGADALSFETILVSGCNSALPHGVPGERIPQAGDMITLDFGAIKNGYHSDMTRTVALGKANARQRAVYATVKAAQEKALCTLHPGVLCSAVDAAAREHIAAAGYGQYFGHGTGHGVGLEIHEAPSVSAKSSHALAPGNVITVEPGIYLPGEFGVRIEDMAVITEDGYENLTSCPKDLLEI